MKPSRTYFGAHVRIESRGPGPDRAQVVQRFNPLANSWLDVRTFDASYDHAYSEARLYASMLSASMRRHENARKIPA
jgi:hypothetical protein